MYKISIVSADVVTDYAAQELKKYLRMMMPRSGEIKITFDKDAKDGDFSINTMIDYVKKFNEYVKLNEDTYNLLKLGIEYTNYTNSYFNIFTGALTDYWDEIFNDAYNFGSLELDPYYNESQKEKLEKLVNAIPITNEDINKVLEFKDETY